jgi:DtxR family Mn-dependent transcriptional regulator
MDSSRHTRAVDYLIAVERICADTRGERATTGAIAAAVGVAKGTASEILKSLARQGLIDLLPYTGSRLTAEGLAQARRTVRRCRMLQLFLMQTLKLSPTDSTIEAWNWEPAASDKLIEQIDRVLARPEMDA